MLAQIGFTIAFLSIAAFVVTQYKLQNVASGRYLNFVHWVARHWLRGLTFGVVLFVLALIWE